MIQKLFDAFKWFFYPVVIVTCFMYGWDSWMAHLDRWATSKEQFVHQVMEPPFVHHGDKLSNNIAHPGELIYVHNKYVRSERCEMRVANLLIDPNTDNVHHFSTFQNWLAAGTFTADEMFVLPDWLPPATYRLVKKTAATCNGRVVYFVNFDLIVDVRPKGS